MSLDLAAPVSGVAEQFVALPVLGGKTRVLTAGAGPPVLLLHGTPENADGWRRVMAHLSLTHRCIAPDLPGYGNTSVIKGFDYSIESQIAFVDQLLAALEIDQPILLIVHGAGGPMGIAWASENLSGVKGLLVLNTTVFSDFDWFSIAKTWANASVLGRLRAAIGMWTIGLSQGRRFKKIFWSTSPELGEADVDRIVRAFALNETAKKSTLMQFREMLEPGFFASFGARLNRIAQSVPTEVLWGSNDPFIADKFAHRFSAATVTMVPKGGHWLPVTQPELVARIARRVAEPLRND